MLASLVVFMIVASLLLQALMTVKPAFHTYKGVNQMEWELFQLNVKREIRKATGYSIKNNKLYLQNKNEIISIEPYGSVIRRRVDGTGHELFLYNINQFEVAKEGRRISIIITDLMNKEFRASFMFLNGQQDGKK
ncbi:competence type IV pilus minor pilin ComGF [Bacillus sp. 1P06AnD]|uniref:competence type IV pilus minor pilin ComGF n=1 Tax=Bacillus sp. 1P06AnD TaxID=3132208 RepID=UPI00399F921F